MVGQLRHGSDGGDSDDLLHGENADAVGLVAKAESEVARRFRRGSGGKVREKAWDGWCVRDV
jgi:hypothetical protein